MRYIGGKFRIAKFIVPVLNRLRGDRDYLEPFIGAANIFCKIPGTRIGSDSHPDLILLLQAVRDGTIAFPDAVSEEEFQRIRREPPSALRGFIGFGCSFAGIWFSGYAREGKRGERNFAVSAATGLRKMPAYLAGTTLTCCDYREHTPRNKLIYCDPPYAATTGYSQGAFDTAAFWDTMREWRRYNTVIVSEYAAPDDWRCIEEIPTLTDMTQDPRIERLFC